MNLFQSSFVLQRIPLKRAYNDLDKVDLQTIDLHIENRKKILLDHFLKNNTFYQNKVTLSNPKWKELPILTKSDFQTSLEKRLSRGYTLKNTYQNKTSGSSGKPFHFARDKYCHAITWASIIKRFEWHDLDMINSYQARYYGMPENKLSRLKLRVKDFFANRYRISISDLSEQGLQNMVDTFRRKPFDYINGYTSSIVLFAKFLKEKQLILKDLCPSLKMCVVTSEMLFDEDKILLEQSLGVPIINEYGCAEVGIIALTNPNGEWEVDQKTVLIEILDEKNNLLPFGEEGKIVVTSLYNLAHPFIRYEVGDYGSLQKCERTGKIFLKTLLGRTNDFVHLPSGRKAPGMVFYVVTKEIMGKDGNLKEFRITQFTERDFEVEYVSHSPLSEEHIKKISKVMTDFLEPGLSFDFVRKDAIERTKTGKLKQFRSFLKH